jgi:ABC-type glycerol-3-phosphate transport system substrate-binding protein
MRRTAAALSLVLVALLLSACGGGGSSSGSDSSTSSSGGGAKTAEQVWAKEVEGVMRQFENASAHSVEAIHTSTSQYNLEPTYATYSHQLAKLGKQLEATDPPASCEALRERMGVLARKVSAIMGVLGDQHELSPEEFSALAYQQGYKFSRVGRQLTNATIHPHC